MHSYWNNTRHPWPCLLFVLPLLAGYEVCMLWQAMDGFTPQRAGMDAWMAGAFQGYGLPWEFAPSVFIGGICLSWAVLKWDRSPPDSLGLWAGIGLESIMFAMALWLLGVVFSSLQLHLTLAPVVTQSVAYLGSGIFEEVLFRLVGFGILFWLFRVVTEDRWAFLAALCSSALGFAAAHYLGSQGEAWQLRSFLFRALAGACFVGLFHYRGLGVAVGTHSAYNVIVGLVN